MKKIFCYSIIIFFVFAVKNNVSAQGANKTLSNLTSPTAVNQNLLPDKDGKHNLGSLNKSWKNLYFDTAVYLRGVRFLASPTGFFPGNIGNTALGLDAMHSTFGGKENIAVGDSSFYSNLYGSNNIAVGYFSLYKNISGNSNTAVGSNALYANSGGGNTAAGAFSLVNNTAGGGNTATGLYALYSNTTADYNTANGYSALNENTTGTYNAAFGAAALGVNLTGSYNTAAGYSALYYNRDSYNTGFGYNSLYLTTTSQYNTAVGYNAGSSYDNGYNNVFLGANVDVDGAGYYNVIAIGQGTVCTASSQVTMGNGATGSYRAYANWSNISDGRFKKNIKENVPGLAFINKLQPITYTLDAAGIENFLHKDQPQNKRISDNSKVTMSKALAEKEKVVYTGFVAQDVEKSAKELNYDFSGVDAAKNSKDLYGLRYAEFVVPLVKAVQELSGESNEMKKNYEDKITDLQKQIDALKAMIGLGNSSLQSTVNNQPSTAVQQNIPNPFQNSTTINYTLPQQYSSAKIIITDNKGVVLKQLNLSTKGKGSVKINASTLTGGSYQYSLYVDGRLIDTKQMIYSK